MTIMRGSEQDSSRRKFLARCGKFAAITPIAVTTLLSLPSQSFATAVSGGGKGGGGGGKGGKGGHGGHGGSGGHGGYGGGHHGGGGGHKKYDDALERLIGRSGGGSSKHKKHR